MSTGSATRIQEPRFALPRCVRAPFRERGSEEEGKWIARDLVASPGHIGLRTLRSVSSVQQKLLRAASVQALGPQGEAGLGGVSASAAEEVRATAAME